jgi:ankyrin repeat protein
LIEAVRAGDEAGVGRALAAGANPDVAAGPFSGPVLVEACVLGKLGVVRLLLDAGAAAGPADPGRLSPLRAAVSEGHAEVAELLVARGALAAEPSAPESLLTTAVAAAARRPRPAALANLRLVLRHPADHAANGEGPIVAAVTHGAAPAVLGLLLDFGADAGQRRSDGTPVLVLAARRGDHAGVDILLRAGAEVDGGDARGRTALMHAVERDERAVVAVLLLAGADPARRTPDGMTAALLAHGWRREAIRSLLGERRIGPTDVSIARTALRVVGDPHRLSADPELFRWFARVVDAAVTCLGDAEWAARTGTTGDTARAVATRLRADPVPACGASWHELAVNRAELATMRAALRELAYGIDGDPPAGIARLDLVDQLAELDRQLGR